MPQLNVILNQEEADMLGEVARQRSTSMSAVVRQQIRRAYADLDSDQQWVQLYSALSWAVGVLEGAGVDPGHARNVLQSIDTAAHRKLLAPGE